MKNIRLDKKTIVAFFQRFHLVIFVVIIVFLLSTAVLMLSGVVNKASGIDSTPQNSSSAFDQATIDKIKKLKTSDEPSEPLNLSQGRINPFNE